MARKCATDAAPISALMAIRPVGSKVISPHAVAPLLEADQLHVQPANEALIAELLRVPNVAHAAADALVVEHMPSDPCMAWVERGELRRWGVLTSSRTRSWHRSGGKRLPWPFLVVSLERRPSTWSTDAARMTSHSNHSRKADRASRSQLTGKITDSLSRDHCCDRSLVHAVLSGASGGESNAPYVVALGVATLLPPRALPQGEERGLALAYSGTAPFQRQPRACMTCRWFSHHSRLNCIPVLTHRCSGWTEDLHPHRGWAPEVA